MAKPGEQLALPAPPLPGQQEPGQELKTENDTAEVTKKSLEDYEAPRSHGSFAEQESAKQHQEQSLQKTCCCYNASNKRHSQPRWSQRLVVLLLLKAAKGKSRTTLARSKSKLVTWASMVARGAEATLKDVTKCWKESYQVKGYLGGSTGMPTVTECRGRLG